MCPRGYRSQGLGRPCVGKLPSHVVVTCLLLILLAVASNSTMLFEDYATKIDVLWNSKLLSKMKCPH